MPDQQQSGDEEARKLLRELELKRAALLAGGGVQRKVASIRAAMFLVLALLILGLLIGLYVAVDYLPRALEQKRREAATQAEPLPLGE